MRPESTYKINVNGTKLERLEIPESYVFKSEKAVKFLEQSGDQDFFYHMFLYLDGCPIGFCILNIDKSMVNLDCYDYFNLAVDYVYIEEDFRGKGYSVFMCEKIMEIVVVVVMASNKKNYYDMSQIKSDEGQKFVDKFKNMLSQRDIFSV